MRAHVCVSTDVYKYSLLGLFEVLCINGFRDEHSELAQGTSWKEGKENCKSKITKKTAFNESL